MITEPEVQSCTIKLNPSYQRSHLTCKCVVTICFCQACVLHRRKWALLICASNLKELAIAEYETIFLPGWLHWKIILISLHWLTERIMKDIYFFNLERRSSDFSTTFSVIFGCLVSWVVLVENRIWKWRDCNRDWWNTGHRCWDDGLCEKDRLWMGKYGTKVTL